MTVKDLSSEANSQLDKSDISAQYIIEIAGVRNNDVLSLQRNFARNYGIATLGLVLGNQSGKYSPGGTSVINLGDTVVLKEKFGAGATDEFTTFTGYVRQRPIAHAGGDNTISLTVYDYIIKLQDVDIEQLFEADKVRITEETLAPVFLSSPNEMFAQLFNFANVAIILKLSLAFNTPPSCIWPVAVLVLNPSH